LSLADFEDYCEEHYVAPGEEPAAFADWLAQQTGGVVIGGPIGEPPDVIAIPDEDND
jgi:hypothetical protein